jgi:uncharacterized membrane protein YvbJ
MEVSNIMKYCTHCGTQLNDFAAVCTHCGCMVGNINIQQGPKEEDAPSTGFAILGFFVPLAGLILWLVWKDEFPLRAKSVGKGALICVIVNVGLAYVYVIAIIIFLLVSQSININVPGFNQFAFFIQSLIHW